MAKKFPAAGAMLKPHGFLLVTLLGICVDLFIRKLHLGEFYDLIWLKLSSCFQMLQYGFYCGIAVAYCFQVADLIMLGMARWKIKAEIQKDSDKIAKEYDQLQDIVGKLQSIMAEVDQLIEQFESTEEFARLSRAISRSLSQANELYDEATKTLCKLYIIKKHIKI